MIKNFEIDKNIANAGKKKLLHHENIVEKDSAKTKKSPTEKIQNEKPHEEQVKGLKLRPQSKNSANNKTFDDAANILDRSAEFPVRSSNETERRKQLNSSFEKPRSNGLLLAEQTQPTRPAGAKSQQPIGRSRQLKNSVDQYENKKEKVFLNDSQTEPLENSPESQLSGGQHSNLKENRHVAPNNNSRRQLKHTDSNHGHKSHSPILKEDNSSHNDSRSFQAESERPMKNLQKHKTPHKNSSQKSVTSATPFSK